MTRTLISRTSWVGAKAFAYKLLSSKQHCAALIKDNFKPHLKWFLCLPLFPTSIFFFLQRKFTLTVRCLATLEQKVQVGSARESGAVGSTAKEGASHVDSQWTPKTSSPPPAVAACAALFVNDKLRPTDELQKGNGKRERARAREGEKSCLDFVQIFDMDTKWRPAKERRRGRRETRVSRSAAHFLAGKVKARQWNGNLGIFGKDLEKGQKGWRLRA